MKRNSVRDLVIFSMVWLAGYLTAFANTEIVAKVTSVIDGNTVELLDSDNQKYKVVLEGIDCPELGQEFGVQAKKFIEKMLLQKDVTVTFHGKDRWGNYRAIVMVKDDDPRIALLKEGLAWTAEKNPPSDLEPYLNWAQQKGRGLWKQQNPTPPWTYRRQQTMMQAKSS